MKKQLYSFWKQFRKIASGKIIEGLLLLLFTGLSISYGFLIDLLEQHLDTWAAQTALIGTMIIIGISGISYFLPKRFKVVSISLAVLMLLLLSGLVGYNLHTRSIPQKTLIVIVAKLDDKANENLYTQDNIVQQLQPYAKEITVIPINKALSNQEEALREAKKKRATIILWGKYAVQGNIREQAAIHVEILEKNNPDLHLLPAAKGELLTRSLKEKDTYVLQTDLKRNVAYVSLFVIGLAKAQQKDWKSASQKFTQALNELPKNSAFIDQSILYRNLGHAYYQQDQYKEAIKYFSEAIKHDPTEPLVWYNRGVSYYALNDLESAHKDYTEAIKRDISYASAYNNRGVIESDRQKHQEAIADFNLAIKYNPKDDLAYFNKAGSEAKLGMYEQALKDYSKAIELNPNRPQNYSARGTVYTYLNNYDRAIKEFSEALKHNPSRIVQKNIYFLRADAYRQQNKTKLALADYNQVLKLDPKDAHMHDVVGGMYFLSKDINKAIALTTKAIEIDPKNAPAYASRGNYYFDKKEFEKGLADFDKATQLDPTLPGPYLGRGTYYAYINNNRNLALQNYQQALKLYQTMLAKEKNPTLQKALQTLIKGTETFIEKL